MNVLLLSVLLGIGQPPEGEGVPLSPEAQPGCATCESCDPDVCGLRGAVRSGVKSLFSATWDWFGPMPQTCYQPRFGCYPGNSRDIHRYPAFHGYYYRQPYNYRHYFEYPWHAEPHEPLGYFSYPQGGNMQQEPSPIEAPATPPEVPAGKTPPSSAQNFPAVPRPLPISSTPWQPMPPGRVRN